MDRIKCIAPRPATLTQQLVADTELAYRGMLYSVVEN